MIETLLADLRYGLRSLRNVVSHQYDFVDHRRLLHFITHLFPATVATIRMGRPLSASK